MPRGGKRPGAGKPKGYQHQATLDKAAAREIAREIITKRLEPILEAQIANAMGIKYLVTRDEKTGKFVRVGEAMAGNTGEKTIEVWEKDPSVEAAKELLNRALDKSTEQQSVEHTGSIAVVYQWKKTA